MVLYIQAQCLMTIRAESMSLVIIKAEGARLESVYTLIAYRGFESLSLRHILRLSLCFYRGFFVSRYFNVVNN